MKTTYNLLILKSLLIDSLKQQRQERFDEIIAAVLQIFYFFKYIRNFQIAHNENVYIILVFAGWDQVTESTGLVNKLLMCKGTFVTSIRGNKSILIGIWNVKLDRPGAGAISLVTVYPVATEFITFQLSPFWRLWDMSDLFPICFGCQIFDFLFAINEIMEYLLLSEPIFDAVYHILI